MLLSLVVGRASLWQAARAAATSPRRSTTRVRREPPPKLLDSDAATETVAGPRRNNAE